MVKYILVTGGVISGLGKGVIASSIGTLLKASGLHVTSIKIDPYINIDAGTFSPYEHGEVFVLDDGGEVDLDLGNYERFLNVTLCSDNNITTGKIYQSVISKERKGDYLGKTVQVVPHITNEIQDWVERVAKRPVDGSDVQPDVCIIELGGTIGDIEGMAFVEAFRQFQYKIGHDNFCVIHVSLVPEPSGEHKTKPTQQSVREIRGLGLSPSFVFLRSSTPIDEHCKNKIAMFCNVKTSEVISVPNVKSLYEVPLLLGDQNLVHHLEHRLHLQQNSTSKNFRKKMSRWKDLAMRSLNLADPLRITLVGKYTKLADSYLSVVKAIQHSALAVGYQLDLEYVEASKLEEATKESDPNSYFEAWQLLCKSKGVIVPGGFGERGVEGKIACCKWARTNKVPCLGICLGFQCQVIEFSRNVLELADANSTEFNDQTAHPVIIDMPEHTTGDMGGTQRLGKRVTQFVKRNSVLQQLYAGKEQVCERHRHRYEVNPQLVDQLEREGMAFVGKNLPTSTEPNQDRMEIMELTGHPFYVGLQCHPEYLSRPLNPSPPYLGLVLAACGKLDVFLSNNCRISARPVAEHNGGTEISESSEDLHRLTTSMASSLFLVEHGAMVNGQPSAKFDWHNSTSPVLRKMTTLTESPVTAPAALTTLPESLNKSTTPSNKQ